MKTEQFEKALAAYCDDYAKNDTAFAAKYHMGTKTIQGCARYILNELEKEARKQKQGTCTPLVMTDAEVYGMAVHYFDEDSIKECKKEPKAHVAVSAPTTEKTKPVATAIIKKDNKTKANEGLLPNQLSLF